LGDVSSLHIFIERSLNACRRRQCNIPVIVIIVIITIIFSAGSTSEKRFETTLQYMSLFRNKAELHNKGRKT